MADNIAEATLEQRQELIGMLVERVVVSDRRVQEIVWVPAARPFLGADRSDVQNGAERLARPEGFEPPTL